MTKIFLLANAFPYGNGETYLENEINSYKGIETIRIISLQLHKFQEKTIRSLPSNCAVYPIRFAPKIIYILNVFRVMLDENLYKELLTLYKERSLKLSKIYSLLIYLSRANYEARKILKYFSKKDLENSVFYSYRFEYQPYVAILLNKWLGLHNKIITRAHGYDLYENRRDNNYIPLRKEVLKNIDSVYVCSQNGAQYLLKKYPEFKEKIKVSYLGTRDWGIQKYTKSEKFRIVSCSNVISIKRINLIVEALEQLDDILIEWTHYGDGVQLEYIKNLSKKLPNNISVIFKGNIANDVLMKEYRDNVYDLFINVSLAEGLPVSIMEATSFGIPCLVTNAGGTSEIIQNDVSGRVLPINSTAIDISKEILFFIKMKDKDYNKFRINARKIWENKFFAKKNYDNFVDILLKN